MSANETNQDIVIPDIGDSDSVEIIELLVAVGDRVSVDDSLLTLESDKASMEVPATHTGVIESLTVAVGDSVASGDVVGTMSVAAEGGGDSGSSQDQDMDSNDNDSGESAQETEADTGSDDNRDDAESNRDADGTASSSEPASRNDTKRESGSGDAESSARKPAAGSSPAPSPTAHIDDEKFRKAHASPGVRLYAREHGADLSLISGSGPKGRISKDDVKAFIKRSLESSNANYGSGVGTLPGGGAGIPPIPEVDFSRFGDVERVPLGRINRLSAANLHRAWLNLPMVTHHDVADVTEMEAFRKQLKNEARESDPKITGLAFHMKALVRTLQAYPRLNSSLSADGEALYFKHYFHIGIAVDTPNGLVVPVFRDVDKKSITQLAREMSDVSSRARNKKLKPDEMQGASMTISSLGGIGGTSFTPIVNPPEVAILGITRATMQPVWNGSEFVPRLMCPLDLTYDHRVVDGADAARFMAYYVKQIADIRRLTL